MTDELMMILYGCMYVKSMGKAYTLPSVRNPCKSCYRLSQIYYFEAAPLENSTGLTWNRKTNSDQWIEIQQYTFVTKTNYSRRRFNEYLNPKRNFLYTSF